MIGQHQTNYFTIFFPAVQVNILICGHVLHFKTTVFVILYFFFFFIFLSMHPSIFNHLLVWLLESLCPVLGRGRTYTVDKFSVGQLIPGQKETETLEWLLSRTSVSLEHGRKQVRMVQMQHKILQPLCNSTSHCTTMLPSYIKHHENFTGTFRVTLSWTVLKQNDNGIFISLIFQSLQIFHRAEITWRRMKVKFATRRKCVNLSLTLV